MNNTELRKKVSILYDMELNNYLMNEMISRLDDRIDALGNKKNFSAPKKGKGDKEVITASMLISAVIAAIIGAVGGIIYNFTVDEGLINMILGFVLCPVFGGGIGALIGLTIGLVIGLICYSREKNEIEKIYEEDCAKLDRAMEKDAVRVRNEKREREILIRQRDELIERKDEATKKLKSFYSTSGIDSRYRNLIPVGYMNEFIRLGISDHLEGADGLYYLIRQELRADQFQCSLDEISSKLDDIIDSNRCIYSEIRSINTKCGYLIDKTKEAIRLSARNNELLCDAVAQTRITAYNTERIAKETEFQNYMLLCR